MSLTVRPVARSEALGFLATSSGLSYLQCPGWGAARVGWSPELLGWYDEADRLCGYGLVLRRAVPRTGRHLAYMPEGPAVAWGARRLGEWLDPLVEHLRSAGAFAVKMSPRVPWRSWTAQTVEDAIAHRSAARLAEVAPDLTEAAGAELVDQLVGDGWRRVPPGSGFPGESDHSFQVPLAGRTRAGVLAGLSQQWRRNIRKAERAGVEVVRGGPADIPAFHRAYRETAGRSRFAPWPLEHFQRLAAELGPEDPDRFQLYLARHAGEVLGAAVDVRVGATVGYAYGGSRTVHREVQPNTLLHWRALCAALDSGADLYDLRGIGDSLDPADPKFGILRFKLGTGGRVVQHIGEWDLPLSRPLYRGFGLYSRLVRWRTERAGHAPAPTPSAATGPAATSPAAPGVTAPEPAVR